MRRQEAGRDPAASRLASRGGQGVHREMESEGLASNLRAVAEAEAMANRSAMSALIRAGSLTAKEIPAERAPRQGVCGRHGGTEERLTWGDLVAFPMKVFTPSHTVVCGHHQRTASDLSDALEDRREHVCVTPLSSVLAPDP